jgi:ribosome biogenesis GTPase A
LQEQIKWVDLVIEVVDARAPLASTHPKSDEIFGNKSRLLVLTKADIADKRELEAWEAKGLVLSLKTGRDKDRVLKRALELTEDKRASLARKGVLPRPMRVCVVGMPNVGKSSLINWLIGTNKTKVADRPGVTRGNQWVRVHPQLELLDTPGILPVSALDRETIIRLALFNLIPSSAYEVQEVAEIGLEMLKSKYPNLLGTYVPGVDVATLTLEEIARQKNFVTAGAKPDHMRAAAVFLSDLRAGKIGRVTIE